MNHVTIGYAKNLLDPVYSIGFINYESVISGMSIHPDIEFFIKE